MNKKLITIPLLLSSLISCSNNKAPTSPSPEPEPNTAPHLTSFSPSPGRLTVFPGQLIDFAVTAADVENDALAYQYALDDSAVATTQTYQLNTDLLLDGAHALTLEVSDPKGAKDNVSWQIEKQDGMPIIGDLGSASVSEDEKARYGTDLFSLDGKIVAASATGDLDVDVTDPAGFGLVVYFLFCKFNSSMRPANAAEVGAHT